MNLKNIRYQMDLSRAQMSLLMGINPYRKDGTVNDIFGKLERGDRELTLQQQNTVNILLFLHKHNLLQKYLHKVERKQ